MHLSLLPHRRPLGQVRRLQNHGNDLFIGVGGLLPAHGMTFSCTRSGSAQAGLSSARNAPRPENPAFSWKPGTACRHSAPKTSANLPTLLSSASYPTISLQRPRSFFKGAFLLVRIPERFDIGTCGQNRSGIRYIQIQIKEN